MITKRVKFSLDKMISRYRSCCQEAKDEINRYFGTLVKNRTDSIVITLDDEENGTCCALRDAGYNGHVSVIQRNKTVISAQLQQFKDLYPDDFKYHVHVGDIAKDLTKLVSLWRMDHPVCLWNFEDIFRISVLIRPSL